MGARGLDAREGAYLTDGVSLFYVLEAYSGRILLENCMTGQLKSTTVAVLTNGRYRLVRPEVAKTAA